MESRLGALPGAAKIDQIECAADLGQALLTNMGVGRCGRESAVAEQPL
jgi:hypothetical protein